MKIRQSPRGFTLIELLVVISIIAILATFAIPGAMGVLDKGKQMQDLASARNVYMGIRTWASDHDGTFPYGINEDSTTTGTPSDAQYSNDAFANLIPYYVPQEKVFWNAKTAYCNTKPPDEQTGNGQALIGGENGYAYVTKLNDSVNPSFPLVADAPKDATGDYDTDPSKIGGMWKGKNAIVVRVDGTAKIELLDQNLHQVKDYTGTGTSKQNIFQTGNTNWLSDTNKLLLPKPATAR